MADKIIINPINPFSYTARENLFFEKRHLFVYGNIETENANILIKDFMFLDSISDKPIKLHIKSYGGEVMHSLALYDVIKQLKSPLYTICEGTAQSMAAILLSSGEKGHRYIHKHSSVMIHQPWVGFNPGGDVTDQEIQTKELVRIRGLLEDILVKNTGQKKSKIHKDTDRDFIMPPKDAKEYGLVDKII